MVEYEYNQLNIMFFLFLFLQ